MSVKQIGGCAQKQQMDWGAAERGGGTQPLFSLLSVCLRVFVCLHVCLPFCLPACRFVWKCLNTHQYAPSALLMSSHLSFTPLSVTQTGQLSYLLSSPHFLHFSFLLSLVCSPFFYQFHSSLYLYLTFPPFSLTMTSKLPFVIFPFVSCSLSLSTHLHQQSHYHLSSYLHSLDGPWRLCRPPIPLSFPLSLSPSPLS